MKNQSVFHSASPAYGTAPALSNADATPEAQALYQYLCGIKGHGILSGQQESTWVNGTEDEMDYIRDTTGKLPAIRGLDFIDNDFEGVIERALDWWKRGGIVSICWHWGAPPDGVGYLSSKESIDLEQALTPGTLLNESLLSQLDNAAKYLNILGRKGVPVLFRPLHEFDGGWFWWGKNGPEHFIRLWRLIYDRYTRHHHLNHLIWVLGYSHKVKRGWYPGDDCVDIAGTDYYGNSVRRQRYQKLKGIAGRNRLLAYHECGRIPSPRALQRKHIDWIWFLTWHTKHIREENTREYLMQVYHHPYVVTLEDLPDWKQRNRLPAQQ